MPVTRHIALDGRKGDKATPENSKDFVVELKHVGGQTLTLTVVAVDAQDVIDTLSERGYVKSALLTRID